MTRWTLGLAAVFFIGAALASTTRSVDADDTFAIGPRGHGAWARWLISDIAGMDLIPPHQLLYEETPQAVSFSADGSAIHVITGRALPTGRATRARTHDARGGALLAHDVDPGASHIAEALRLHEERRRQAGAGTTRYSSMSMLEWRPSWIFHSQAALNKTCQPPPKSVVTLSVEGDRLLLLDSEGRVSQRLSLPFERADDALSGRVIDIQPPFTDELRLHLHGAVVAQHRAAMIVTSYRSIRQIKDQVVTSQLRQHVLVLDLRSRAWILHREIPPGLRQVDGVDLSPDGRQALAFDWYNQRVWRWDLP